MKGLRHVLSAKFQKDIENETRKWDKEWMRYFSLGKDYSFYFYDMDTSNYCLEHTLKNISSFDKEAMYSTKLFRQIPSHVWVDGVDIVGKTVLEIGCGPGLFGRLAGRMADRYVGVDISKFAISIAKLTSPHSSTYIHYSETEKLKELKDTFDTCVGRHFFIHHNYSDSLWLLSFLKDITKSGGIISADFYSNVSKLNEDRRVSSDSDLLQEHPSALYDFSDDDIYKLASELSLECISIDYKPEYETRFAVFKV